MSFDDLGLVKALRNSGNRTAIGVITLIIGIIVFLIFGIGNLLPDYDERIVLLEDDWASYPVSIYGPMFEGDEVKIEFDVLEDERVNMFILDEENYMRLVEGQSYVELFEISYTFSGKETYTLIKDGPIYIIFHNANTHAISLDVVITDLSVRIYGIFGLLFGLALVAIGIISLTGKSGLKENEQFPIPENYPNQRQTDIICELCQRKFASHEHLEEHYQKSELHRKNLEDYNKQRQH